jgi:hypothetical protein
MHPSKLLSKLKLAVFSCAAVTGFTGLCAEAQSLPGVTFGQDGFVNTTGDESTIISTFGSVEVNTSILSSAMGNGYLSVGDADGDWLVQNLPVTAGSPGLESSFPLLGATPGSYVGSAELSFSYTPKPIPVYPPPSNSGGSYYPPSSPGQTMPPITKQYCGVGAAVYTPPVPAAAPPAQADSSIIEAGVPNMQAADQQCVPAAFANDFVYLQNRYGIPLPAADVQIPGRFGGTNAAGGANVLNYFVPTGANTPNAQNEAVGVTLVGDLDRNMARGDLTRAPNAVGNAGVAINAQLGGLTSFITGSNIQDNVGILTQGVPLNTNFNNAGAAVSLNNSVPTLSFIQQALTAGDTVEGNYVYANGGAHAVDIIGAGVTNNQPWIQFQSDWVQTGNLDPFDQFTSPAGAFDIHFSDVTATANTTVGVGGLELLNEPDPANTTPVLYDLTVLYNIPEPTTAALMLLGAPLLMRRKGRRLPA